MMIAYLTPDELANVIKMYERGKISAEERNLYCKVYHWYLGVKKPESVTIYFNMCMCVDNNGYGIIFNTDGTHTPIKL